MTDLISRQAALDIVFDFAETPHRMYQQIRELPTIDHVKRGKWMFEPGIMYCSVCGWLFSYENGLEEEYEYCPHCGAQMERSDDGET